ncbi:MAG: adenylosuccinate lyase [Eudoraea sp.]|nr:adenylosuccinate lyase [Eudoraea sp.]
MLCQDRENRLKIVALLKKNPEAISILLDMIFADEEEFGLIGGWTLDLALQEDLCLILPYLDQYCEGIVRLKNESAIRSMSKISATLMEMFYHRQDSKVQSYIKPIHKETMAEVCFDWLIGEHKVAAKVFSMSSLYELGKEFDWIHSELKVILERGFEQGSAGYRSRARKVLDKLRESTA